MVEDFTYYPREANNPEKYPYDGLSTKKYLFDYENFKKWTVINGKLTWNYDYSPINELLLQ
jgi:hypothetical protein